MAMTVGELKALLEGLDDEVEVRIATQPNYPFENSIAGLKVECPEQERIDELEEALYGDKSLSAADKETVKSEIQDLKENSTQIVYILEGQQLGYGKRDWWCI